MIDGNSSRTLSGRPEAPSSKRGLSKLWFLLSVLPPALIVVIIARFAVDVPMLDDWATVRLFNRFRSGTLTLLQLGEQHNESRKFFARILELLVGTTTGWDLRHKMFATVVVALVALGGLAVLLRRTMPASGVALPVFLTSLFFFGPIQHQNWLWAIQLSLFLPIALLLGGLVVITSGPALKASARIGLAALLAVVASFSYVNGLLCCLLLAPPLAVALPSRLRFRFVVAWIAGSVLVFAAYFFDYQRPGQAPSTGLFFTHPVDAALYFFTFLGSPFRLGPSAVALTITTVTGAILFVAFLALAVRRLRAASREGALPVALAQVMVGCYALGSGAMNTVGRLGFGRTNALSSRYTSVAVLLVLSIVQLHFSMPAPGRSKLPGSALAALGFSLLAALHLAASSLALGPIRDAQEGLLQAKATLLFLETIDDPVFVDRVWPEPAAVRPIAREANRLGYFRPPLYESAELPPAAFDEHGGESFGWIDRVTRGGGALEATGWAVLPGGRRLADLVVLTARSGDRSRRVVAIASGRLERDDVAARLAEPGYQFSGWKTTVGRSDLAEPGAQLEAWAVDARDGRLHRLAGTTNVP